MQHNGRYQGIKPPLAQALPLVGKGRTNSVSLPGQAL